jgi:hypothetical protein
MIEPIIEKNIPIPNKINPGSKWGKLKNVANDINTTESVVFYSYDFLTDKNNPTKEDQVQAVRQCSNAAGRLATFIRRRHGKGSYRKMQLPFLARNDKKYIPGATVQGYRIWRVK